MVKVLTKVDSIESKKDAIIELFNSKFYKETIIACNELLTMTDEEDKRNKRFSYLQMSTAYYKLEQHEKAIEYAEEALKHIDIKNMYYSCRWNQSRSYLQLGEIQKCVDLANECIEFYKHCNMYNELGSTLTIKGKALKDESILLEAIESYNKAINFKQERIDYVYSQLIDIYLADINTYGIKAQWVLHKIKDVKTKKELEQRYSSLMEGGEN